MRKYVMLGNGILKLFHKKITNLKGLKVRGIKYFVGKYVRFWIHSGGYFDMGTKTWFSDFCSIEVNGGKLKLGYNNFFNTNCKLVSMNNIEIGDNNLFGPNIVIVDHKHNYNDANKLICKQGMSSAPVKIESNVWICANVVITQGVTIGNHIIVAANSVVSKDLLEPGVYAGSPAKMVKKL
ncbi:acyltransferase [Priestia megaterium]|uniref:acyltransferase n=1 Tax=Priestia megaterium TaxID=1404 RepID=UPI00209E99FD|nr:acyltransferase [Priestia megaterium]MCP1450453.1 maltose O-acetyltransferase [Priestia megaterium]